MEEYSDTAVERAAAAAAVVVVLAREH